MIAGVGIDLTDSSRLRAKIRKPAFVKKVFSESEVAYCEKQRHKEQHYAARFAAKEAFLKATGLGLMAGYDLHELEVIHDQHGCPSFRLTGKFLQRKKTARWRSIRLSISHSKSVACAVVIIEK